MTKILQYGGWVVAVIMLICCGVLFNQLLGVNRLLNNAQTERVAVVEADGATSELEEKLANMAAELARSRKEVAALKMPAPETGDETPDDTDVAQEDAEEAESTAMGEEPESNKPSQGERMARAQISTMADMIYADFMQELGLSPEQFAPLKDIIAASMYEQQKLLQGALKAKDRTAKAVRADRDALRATLRDDLKGTMTAEELAAYDDYEPVADQILYEKMVDGQLNMLASGLNSENRTLTSQVVAEELIREFDTLDQSDELYTLGNFNAAQTRALNTTLDRLGETLAEDQLALVNGYVNQALTMFEAMADKEE